MSRNFYLIMRYYTRMAFLYSFFSYNLYRESLLLLIQYGYRKRMHRPIRFSLLILMTYPVPNFYWNKISVRWIARNLYFIDKFYTPIRDFGPVLPRPYTPKQSSYSFRVKNLERAFRTHFWDERSWFGMTQNTCWCNNIK